MKLLRLLDLRVTAIICTIRSNVGLMLDKLLKEQNCL